MVVLKRLGGSFSHAHSSTLWKTSRFVKYANVAEHSISIDNFSPATYCWLHESKSIIPKVYSYAKDNVDKLKQMYKLVLTHDYELIKLDRDLFKFVPACGYWIDIPFLHKKTKLLSFISSNKCWTNGHNYRLSWVEKLKNKCDLYGRGFNEIQKKEEGLVDYMFSVAIENGKYDAYFTEKILDCFATGTIPVYYGTEKISEYFNPDGIIMLSDDFDPAQLNKELYESKSKAVKDNFNIVLNYNTVEDWIVRNGIIDN